MSQKDKFGVAIQSSGVGTKVTTAEWWIPVSSAELKPNRESLKIDETIGIRVPLAQDTGTKTYGGTVKGAVRPGSFPALLAAAWGAPCTTASACTGAYTHVFDPCVSGKLPLPLSAYLVYGDPTTPIVDLFYDVFLNSIEVSCSTDDYMMFDADCVALHLDTAQANPTVTSDTTTKMTFKDLAATMTVAGCTTTVSLSDFRLRWNNNIDADPVAFGSTEASSVTPGSVSIEGSFTITGSNNISTHYRRALLDDPTSVQLVLTATGGVIGSTACSYVISYDIKQLNYTDAPVSVNAAEPLRAVEVTFGAFLNESLSQAVVVTVTNNHDGTKYV